MESSEEERTFEENTETLNSFPDSDENLEVEPEENRSKLMTKRPKISSQNPQKPTSKPKLCENELISNFAQILRFEVFSINCTATLAFPVVGQNLNGFWGLNRSKSH